MVEAVFFYIAFGNIGFLYAVSEAPWRRNVLFTWKEERLNENMVKPSCATVVVQFNLHLHFTFSPFEGIQFFKFIDCINYY